MTANPAAAQPGSAASEGHEAGEQLTKDTHGFNSDRDIGQAASTGHDGFTELEDAGPGDDITTVGHSYDAAGLGMVESLNMSGDRVMSAQLPDGSSSITFSRFRENSPNKPRVLEYRRLFKTGTEETEVSQTPGLRTEIEESFPVSPERGANASVNTSKYYVSHFNDEVYGLGNSSRSERDQNVERIAGERLEAEQIIAVTTGSAPTDNSPILNIGNDGIFEVVDQGGRLLAKITPKATKQVADLLTTARIALSNDRANLEQTLLVAEHDEMDRKLDGLSRYLKVTGREHATPALVDVVTHARPAAGEIAFGPDGSVALGNTMPDGVFHPVATVSRTPEQGYQYDQETVHYSVTNTYDADGRIQLELATLNDGAVKRTEHDDGGTRETSFDKAGNPEGIIVTSDTINGPSREKFDANGEPVDDSSKHYVKKREDGKQVEVIEYGEVRNGISRQEAYLDPDGNLVIDYFDPSGVFVKTGP